jgi:hypothetical protein
MPGRARASRGESRTERLIDSPAGSECLDLGADMSVSFVALLLAHTYRYHPHSAVPPLVCTPSCLLASRMFALRVHSSIHTHLPSLLSISLTVIRSRVPCRAGLQSVRMTSTHYFPSVDSQVSLPSFVHIKLGPMGVNYLDRGSVCSSCLGGRYPP